MYAIISKRNHEWLSKIDKQKGVGSSHYVKTGKIPLLFETKDLARIELIMYHLSQISNSKSTNRENKWWGRYTLKYILIFKNICYYKIPRWFYE